MQQKYEINCRSCDKITTFMIHKLSRSKGVLLKCENCGLVRDHYMTIRYLQNLIRRRNFARKQTHNPILEENLPCCICGIKAIVLNNTKAYCETHSPYHTKLRMRL